MKQGYKIIEYATYREIKNKKTGQDLSTITYCQDPTNYELAKASFKKDSETLNLANGYESEKHIALPIRFIKKVTVVSYEGASL